MAPTRKREVRKSLRQPGWITLDGGFAARPCVVQDISSAGAKITADDANKIAWHIAAGVCAGCPDGAKLSGGLAPRQFDRRAIHPLSDMRRSRAICLYLISRHRRRDKFRKSRTA